MGKYPLSLYVRIINPGTSEEYLITGTEPSDVDATHIGDTDSAEPRVARYSLAGTGSVHFTAPVYVEDAST